MPYINGDFRVDIMDAVSFPNNPGELNYKLTMVLKDYMDAKGLSYQTINDIMGAIEGAKLEFYRRIATPYEETKIKENGDVY